MDITFRLPGAWGPGKGTNLQPSEVDNNFWSLAQAIVELQNDPTLPNGIATIAVSGTQMTITLNDGTVMGPFTLPVLTFRWRGEWQPETAYAELDVFTVTSVGIFMVLLDHTSDPEFDANRLIDDLAAYLQLFGSVDVRLSGLPDVQITNLQSNDFLSWAAVDQKWENRQLNTMAFQDSWMVAITGGTITGMAAPTQPTDVVNKAYVDSLPAGMTSPNNTLMANISGTVAAAIPNTLTDFLDHLLGSGVRGTLMYRGGSGWTALGPGTSGLFLKTSGAGADPVWSVGGSGVTSVAAGAGITTGAGPITATGSVALAAIADNSLLANVSGTTVAPSATTLSAILDRVMSSTRGSVLVRAGGGWVALAPGTAGYFLQTQGSTADPQWASPAGAGTVTSVSAGTGISTGGAPITGAGTVSLAAIANLSVLANISGGSAAPVPATATALFDALFGATQGAVLYRSASAWAMLSPGTAGQVLTTGGAAANPAWANAAAGAPIANLLLLANISGATAAASGNTLSNILDAVISSSRGTLLYRGASGWAALAPGTTGQLLQTGGAAGDPSWVTGATGGASITTSDTPPASPADGDAWWDSVGGQLYISYADANSQQWVPATNSQGPAGATGATGPTGPTGATGPTGPAGSANMSLMTAGQIPIAASATSATSSANLSGDVTSAPTTLVTTLATVNSNVGTFQGLTLDAKGRVTAAAFNSLTQGPDHTIVSDRSANGALLLGGTGDPTNYSRNTNHFFQNRAGSATWLQASSARVDAQVPLRVLSAAGVVAQLNLTISGGHDWQLFNAVAGTFNIYDNATPRFIIDTAGGTYNTSGAWILISSDARLKEGVVDYERGLAAIEQLRPVLYHYSFEGDGAPQRLGLIAQEVEPVMPELVSEVPPPPGAPELAEGEDPYLSLTPGNVVFALINAVKELAARVAALEAGAAP